MELLWLALALLQRSFLLLWTAGCILLALAVRLGSGDVRLPLAMARSLWAPPLFRIAGVRLEVSGLEHIDPGLAYLYAANHQSSLDTPALFVALPAPLRFVARAGLRRIPFLGWYMAAMGMVFVDRSSRARGAAATRRAVAILAGGGSLLTFPEGTRTRDGWVGLFKGSALVSAIEASVPVVPVAIRGAHQVLPRGGFRARPGTIHVKVCRPVATAGLGVGDRHTLAREVQARVAEAVGEG